MVICKCGEGRDGKTRRMKKADHEGKEENRKIPQKVKEGRIRRWEEKGFKNREKKK